MLMEHFRSVHNGTHIGMYGKQMLKFESCPCVCVCGVGEAISDI